MIKKINHIGVAVKDLGLSEKLFSDLFGKSSDGTEKVESEKVEVSFFSIGGTKLELLKSLDENSAIEKFISKRGEGINHICLETDNLDLEIERLSNLGFQFVNKNPIIGAHNYKIVFLHPKSTNGVLVELCEKI